MTCPTNGSPMCLNTSNDRETTRFLSPLSLVRQLGVFLKALYCGLEFNMVQLHQYVLSPRCVPDTCWDKAEEDMSSTSNFLPDFVCLLLSPKQVPFSPLVTDLQVFESSKPVSSGWALGQPQHSRSRGGCCLDTGGGLPSLASSLHNVSSPYAVKALAPGKGATWG